METDNPEVTRPQATLTIGGSTFELYAPRPLLDKEIFRAVLDYMTGQEIADGATYQVSAG